MTMKVVHLGTVIQTTFGLVDDDGNVSAQPPIHLNVSVFSKTAFADAQAAIAGARDSAAAEFDKAQSATPDQHV